MRYHILGAPVDAVTMTEAVARVKEMLAGGRPNKIFTPNPEILLSASRDGQYRAILKTADLALPDGIGLVWMGRLLGAPFKERVAGTDFMLKLCGLAAGRGKSIFLVGGRNGVAEKTAAALKKQWPHLQIAGWLEDHNLARQNAALRSADVLFVALGAGKQEKWICDNLADWPNVKIAMAVGGAFDMISGGIPRAPVFLRRIGFEWLWRFMMEPRKRFRRMVNAVIMFPTVILLDRLIDKSKFRNQNVK